METGYEILFFWVARMVLFGLEIMGELPFHTVYLHGTVRDVEGAKMSKTKGNVLDPTEVTAEYGADALRFALVTQSVAGQRSAPRACRRSKRARNFANKLWNATRFALRPIGEAEIVMDDDGPARPDRRPGPGRSLDPQPPRRHHRGRHPPDARRYQYGEAGRQIREFVWSELCDWYIEAAKVRLRGHARSGRRSRRRSPTPWSAAVRLLHPFMPFVTEALWQELPHVGESMMIAAWPEAGTRDDEAEDSVRRADRDRPRHPQRPHRSGRRAGRWIAAEIFPGRLTGAFESLRGASSGRWPASPTTSSSSATATPEAARRSH